MAKGASTKSRRPKRQDADTLISDTKPRPRPLPAAVAPQDDLGAASHGKAFWTAHGGAIALITFVVACTFGRSLGFGFLSWDDDQHIVHNRLLASGAWYEVWYKPHMAMFIPPIYTLWYALSHLTTTLDPALFHAANLIVHTANALLVYLLAWSLPASRPDKAVLSSWQRQIAAIGASLFFALQPIAVETVAWISAMRDLLSATGALVATYLFVVKRGPKATVGAWAAFIFATLCKPSAVAVPVAVLALAWSYQKGTFSLLVKRLTPWLAAVIPIIWITSEAQKDLAADPLITGLNPFERLLIALDSYGFYLKKWLLPLTLTNDYGRSPAAAFASSSVWFYAGAFVCAAGAALAAHRWLGRRVLGWLMFAVVMLLPTSGLLVFAFQHTSTVADHYMYVSLAGLSIALAALLVRLPRPLALGALLAVAGTWCYLSFTQLAMWRSDETLFPAMVAANPLSYAGHTGLSALEVRQGHFEEALTHLRAAEALEPRKVDLLANKASALNQLGRYDEVLKELANSLPSKQIVLDSAASATAVAVLYVNYAYAEIKRGKLTESLPHLCLAQWADPNNNEAKTFLPYVLQALGRDANDPRLCEPFIR